MEVFSKAFNWLADLSAKLPAIDFKMYFIIVVAVICAVGIVIALTLLGSRASKLKRACKSINKYLDGVDAITDENVGDFTAQCFSDKTPQSLRDSWAQYVGVRFGYPSEIVSEQNVYDKEVKKVGNGRANLFAGISLILVALFAFWGFGTLESVDMGIIHCAGLLLIGVIYLVIFILSRSQAKKCLDSFDAMLEDLDAKVNLQVDSNYALDSSPLSELQALADEIVARNTSKEINIEDDAPATPIEALIEDKEYLESELIEDEDYVESELIEDENVEQTSIDDIVEEQVEEVEEPIVEEAVEETVAEEELVEEVVADDALEEESVVEEETIDEDVADDVSEEEPVEELATEEESVEDVVEEPVEETTEDEIEEVAEDQPVDEEPVVGEESQEELVEEEQAQEEVATESVEEQVEDSVDMQEEEVVEETPAEESVVDDEPIVDEEQPDETVVEDESVEEQAQEEVAAESVEEPVEDNTPVEEPVEESVDDEQPAEEQVDEQDDEQTVEDSAVEDAPTSEPVDEQVDDSADEEVEEEEPVEEKPSKMAKLSNLVDYMLNLSVPRGMKIQIAGLMIGAYNKADNKADKRCIVDGLKKIIGDLQK